MINADELAICKRRGHDLFGIGMQDTWRQCKWCGIWIREVHTLEEREDEPPHDEQNPFVKIQRKG
jgi:hypothetical protein